MWLPEESVEMPSTGTSVDLATNITRRPGTQASEKYDGGDVLGLCLPTDIPRHVCRHLYPEGKHRAPISPGRPSNPGQPAVALDSDLKSLPNH